MTAYAVIYLYKNNIEFRGAMGTQINYYEKITQSVIFT